MNRMLAEWVWRVALLAALGSIAWELQRLDDDLNPAGDGPATVASAQDDALDSLDALRDDIEALTQKVNAMLVVMARAK